MTCCVPLTNVIEPTRATRTGVVCASADRALSLPAPGPHAPGVVEPETVPGAEDRVLPISPTSAGHDHGLRVAKHVGHVGLVDVPIPVGDGIHQSTSGAEGDQPPGHSTTPGAAMAALTDTLPGPPFVFREGLTTPLRACK